MLVATTIIGILSAALLIIHTFLTSNVLERNCNELFTELEKYYSKE